MDKILALGSQEFSQLIKNNCIYVDKTQDIFRLVTQGKFYFMSRPRRFGKSLLINTLKELFLGNKALFKGLWIYNKWDWEKKAPVIKFSFSNIGYDQLGLEKAIDKELDAIAISHNIKLQDNVNPLKLRELISKLSQNGPVAILIDEYDKPIIDYIGEAAFKKEGVKTKAEENRDILKNFYSILKDADEHIRFFFVTGVSKFSQVSIFSDLNNLLDISLSKTFSTLLGWTRDEITAYFPGYIKKVELEYKDVYPDVMDAISMWYNGYSWDGITRLFNPVSIMNLFTHIDFRNYWFATGTPTFLIKFIKHKNILPYYIENAVVSSSVLDKYEIENISLIPLLFQTGYLTIKEYNIASGEYVLGYPNQEVARSFSEHFLSEHTTGKFDETDILLNHIKRNLLNNEIEYFVENMNTLFANIPYTLVEKSENYFHSLFYLIIKLIGYSIESEVLTIKGRIDAVVKTEDRIYILEFKIDQSSKQAIQQIKNRGYCDKYKNDKRQIVLLGINFNTKNKVIEDYQIEDL